MESIPYVQQGKVCLLPKYRLCYAKQLWYYLHPYHDGTRSSLGCKQNLVRCVNITPLWYYLIKLWVWKRNLAIGCASVGGGWRRWAEVGARIWDSWSLLRIVWSDILVPVVALIWFWSARIVVIHSLAFHYDKRFSVAVLAPLMFSVTPSSHNSMNQMSIYVGPIDI